jgi:hydroxyacylglutathione hydrolase
MKIETIPQGSYQTNSYVLSNEDGGDCVIIDTGLENNDLMSYLKESKLNPLALLLTHGHLDHIIGIPQLREQYPAIKVYIHKYDSDMLGDPCLNMSAHSGVYEDFSTDTADELLEDGQEMDIAGMRFKMLHIPGHTKGGIAIYMPAEKVVFTGDCVFAGSVGRTDFPGYDEQECLEYLINGIKEKIISLDEDTRLLPGHGPATTIRCEKKHNPYMA